MPDPQADHQAKTSEANETEAAVVAGAGVYDGAKASASWAEEAMEDESDE